MNDPRRTARPRPLGERADESARTRAPTDDEGIGSRPSTAPPPTEETAPSGRDTPADEGASPILVVEDNARLRRLLRHVLEPTYHVLEAQNGREGLRRARRAVPSLIVSDVMMPEIDGLTMVERLRESPRTRHIPTVVLTVRGQVEERREGLRRGAVAYVTKPFDVEVLTAQIRSLLSTRRQLRAHLTDQQSGEADRDRGGLSSFEDRVREAIRRHLADPDCTVEQLAEEIGLTRRSLARKTKKHLGQTPSQLIRTMRLERGARLLSETTETVSQIAYAVGFNSLSYFSRSFRSHFGVPPSTYREEKM